MKASCDKLKNACQFALDVFKSGAEKRDLLLQLCDSCPEGYAARERVKNKAVKRLLGNKVAHEDTEELEKLIGIYCSNSHAMLATGEAGIFPLTAMLNHSCDPNCVFSADPDGTLYVAVCRDVDEGDELCVAYIEMSGEGEPLEQRRERLRESFHFVCQCSRCQADEAEARALCRKRGRKKRKRP